MTDIVSKDNARMRGVDWLSMWCFGDFWFSRRQNGEGVFQVLEKARERSTDGEDLIVIMGGKEFILSPWKPRGCGAYGGDYLLDFEGIKITICPESNLDDEKRPLLRVEATGSILTRLGYLAVMDRLRDAFAALGFEYERSQLSRVDLRCDFTSFEAGDIWDGVRSGRSVTRSKQKFSPWFAADMRCETVQYGHRGDSAGCSLRVYDKLQQAKDYEFVKQYILGGVDAEVCTRVEFELSRKCLRNTLKINSLEDLEANMQTVCGYLTTVYFRVQKSVNRSNTSRGEIDPHWQTVVDAFAELGRTYDSKPTIPAEPEFQSLDHATKSMVGYLSKIAAMQGLQFNDESALTQFVFNMWRDMADSVQSINTKVREKMAAIEAKKLDWLESYFDAKQRGAPDIPVARF